MNASIARESSLERFLGNGDRYQTRELIVVLTSSPKKVNGQVEASFRATECLDHRDNWYEGQITFPSDSSDTVCLSELALHSIINEYKNGKLSPYILSTQKRASF